MKEINLKNKGKYGSSRDKALTYTEREFLINKIEDTKDRIILIGCGYGGLRHGELEQCRFSWLQWKDFGKNRVLAINIPEEDKNIKNKLKIWRPKTKRARTSYIFDSVLAREFYNFFKDNSKGINMSPRNITEYRVKKQMGSLLGRKISSHCLRAGSVSYLKDIVGLQPNSVSVILGHRDQRTTMKHYESLNQANTEADIVKKIQVEK